MLVRFGCFLNPLPKRKSRKQVRHIQMMLGVVTKKMKMSTVKVEAVDGKFSMDVTPDPNVVSQ